MKKGAVACADPGGCACPRCLAARAKDVVRARPWLAGTVDTAEEDYASPGFSRKKRTPAELMGLLRVARHGAREDGEQALGDTEGALAAGAVPRAREIGLNSTQFGQYEREGTVTKFGDNAEQAEDCVRLGATILRRVGTMDLIWANLSYSPDYEHGKVGGPVVVDPETIRSDIDSLNRDRLTDFLRTLHAQHLKVILTCFLWEARVPSADSRWRELGVAEPLKLLWHPDHRPDDLRTAYDGSMFGRANYELLNIEVPYQVDYLTYMAEGIGRLLRSAATTLSGEGIDIGDVIAGLELFSGISDRNVVPIEEWRWDVGDPLASADYWAAAWWRCAKALYDDLATDGRLLPFYLPGFVSYYERLNDSGSTESRNSHSYMMAFFEAFVAKLQILYAMDTAQYGGPFLADVVRGVNYQWDHRAVAQVEPPNGGGDRLGPRHIWHLYREVALVRESLDALSLPDVQIVVLDTGISVTDADEFCPAWMSDPEEFQAYEVWRRLSGALAAGARAAGWDAWMATRDTLTAVHDHDEGYGKGLREDGWPVTEPAALAVPRESWIAFQRFTELLGGITSGGFVHPTFGVHAEFVPRDEDHLIVLRFRLGLTSAYSHAYVILIDPGAPSHAAWHIRAEWAGSAGTLVRFDTESRVRSPPSGGDILALPEVVAYFPSSSEETLPWEFGLRPSTSVRVMHATKSVRWTVSYDP